MITVSVDPESPTPAFEQLRSQLESAVRTGVLSAGQALPTVRQLAADLSLAPNTVGRAYRELERAGVIRTQGRRGTVVADLGIRPTAERRKRLAEAAERFAAEAVRLGASIDETIDAVRQAPSISRPARS